MAMLTNDWADALKDEFRKPYYRELYNFVKEEYATITIYPPSEDIFNALHYTPLNEVKVVILGQDPYHNVNQAHGLCFSVLPSQPDIPPSLQNIYKRPAHEPRRPHALRTGPARLFRAGRLLLCRLLRRAGRKERGRLRDLHGRLGTGARLRPPERRIRGL